MKFKTFLHQLNGSKTGLAVLIDPDKFNPELIRLCNQKNLSCFLVGGSSLKQNNVSEVVKAIKKLSKVPVVLFPGDETQLTKEADGMLLLSLLSGRNPEYLIEKHVRAAPRIKKMKLETLPTAYLLIDGGKTSATEKISKTQPLDPAKIQHIVNTAIAAEQLGFKAIYLEAGSGAIKNVPVKLFKSIKRHVSLPLIIGGGISSGLSARSFIKAGASMLVVGNALEKNPNLIKEIEKEFI
jgi:phosphoglycerol geranylgeranyltransferase